MSRKCQLSGKSGMTGNRVSHSMRHTKVRLQANIQSKRIFVPSLKKFVRLKVCTSALRTINKIGIEAYAKKVGLKLA